MDAHETLDLTVSAKILRRQEQIQAVVLPRLRGQPAGPPKKSRVEIIRDFRRQLKAGQAAQEEGRSDGAALWYNAAVSPYFPCIQPLCDLAKIMVRDMLLETRHRGNYLLLRSVTPPHRSDDAVCAIVEDEHGDVLCLALCHQEREGAWPVEEIMGKGTVMIVKEPRLAISCLATEMECYGLSVDHISDIVLLSADDERVPARWQKQDPSGKDQSAVDWKTRGNDSFTKSQFRAAIES
jgi:hypothetical protein